MVWNLIKINHFFPLYTSKVCHPPPLYHIQVENELIPFSTSDTNLGAIINETLSFEGYVKHIFRSSFYRIVTLTQKYDHITPVLTQPHWLPIHNRIVFKILLLAYKSLNGLCPIYLSSLLYHRKSTRFPRSVSNELLLFPGSNYKTNGNRSFSVCALKLWNSLRKSSSSYF